MAHGPKEQLVAAWVPSEFKEAVRSVAKAADTSESEILRRGLAHELIGVAEAPPEDEETSNG